MIITIGGTPGSGKSTIGRMLATRLNIPFFSMGDIRREFAKQHGITLAELNRLSETDPESDRLVDEFQAGLAQKHESFVVDSRLGWHFLPDSVKIFLKTDLRVAAKRIFDQQRAEEQWDSIEHGVREMEAREASDKKRYATLYNIDHTDISNYDLIIDGTTMTPLEKLEVILLYLKEHNLYK